MFDLPKLAFVDSHFCLFLDGAVEKIGESWKLRQPNAEDPLMASVELLEFH
jgi:hypothetical protein